jgi:hypothetical protein
MKNRRIHEYPAHFYESHEEWKECRRIAFWHAVFAWIFMLVFLAGFVVLGLTIVALFRA